MTSINLLSILLLFLHVSQYKFQESYNNGIGAMREVQAYDDLRILASRNIQQDYRNDIYLESLFFNLTNKYGLEQISPEKSVPRLLSTKQSPQRAFEAEQYATIVLKVTEKIVTTNADRYSYENYKIPQKFCPKKFLNNVCDPNYPYRSIDGSCNNLQNPWWGAANTPYKRLLRAEYDDGIGSMRQNSAVRNYYLPNARLVSITLHKPNPTTSVWSNYAISFGQSLAHDLSGTFGPKNPDGSDFVCECNTKNDHCYSIPIPEKDGFYKQNPSLQCYPFTRNLASVKDYDCNYGPREQLNHHNHFLDLRFIYANPENTRLRQRGYLSFSVNTLGEVTFKLKSPNSCPFGRGSIYHTGDQNAEQNVYLTGVQNVWLRNHNQLAEALIRINPNWDDETIFQQARRLNIAMYQHVIYNEYLPQLIGPGTMRIFDLEPLRYGYSNKYNPDLYPQLLNEFVTAAYRHHFLVNHKQCWADERMKLFGCHALTAGVKNSSHSCASIDEAIRGQVAQPAYYSTPQINWFLNNVLLNQPSSIGVLNIQRGRDHGIRGYNYYRELCGLNRARSFDELYNIPPSVRTQLMSLYYHVDDIDLWSGGASELPLRDAYIGHTFSCIIGKQFQDLKRGDRFYYEHGHSSTTKFTPEQLNTIRSTALSEILCRNMDAEFVPKWPFLVWNPTTNPFVRCKDISRVSLKAWKEI